jgi:hypothetical protein
MSLISATAFNPFASLTDGSLQDLIEAREKAWETASETGNVLVARSLAKDLAGLQAEWLARYPDCLDLEAA